jgi:hypothetical protein
MNPSLGGGLSRLLLIRQATASLRRLRGLHIGKLNNRSKAGRQEFVAITEAFNFA